MWIDSSAWTEHNQGPWDPQYIGGQTAGLNTNQWFFSICSFSSGSSNCCSKKDQKCCAAGQEQKC